MAKLSGSYSVDLSKFLNGLDSVSVDIDEIAKECIDATSDILADAFKSQIASVTSAAATGELARSIQPTKAKTNQYGNFAAVRPVGTHAGGTRNAEVLAYVEYGTSKRNATPVRAAAIAKAEPQIKAKIEQMFNEKVNQKMK